MPLSLTPERYQQIKASVEAQRAKEKIAEIATEPDKMAFATVDALFDHLDAVTNDEPRPKRSRRERR